MKYPLFVLLLLTVLTGALAQDAVEQGTLEYHYSAYEGIPIRLRTDERTVLIFRQGYLSLSPFLEADKETLLSLYLSEDGDWKGLEIQDAIPLEESWLILDEENRLLEGDPADGEFRVLFSIEEYTQRIVLLDRDHLLLFNGKWQLMNRTEGWSSVEKATASAMSFPMGYRNGEVWFFDPLTRSLMSSSGGSIVLDPLPGDWILSGLILDDSFFFVDQSDEYYYNLQGKLISQRERRNSLHFLLSSAEGRLYRYLYDRKELELSEGDSSMTFHWTDSLEIDLYKACLPELLDSSWGDSRNFLGWALKHVNRIYLENPLDRELRDLKKTVEEKLKS